MSLDAIGTAGSTGGQSARDRARIADNFDAFLLLLTTQLQHQNPLDPMNTNEFTQQLVQFAGVEQSIRTNENLESLIRVSAASAATAAASFIGKRITVETARADLKDGRAEWDLQAAEGANTATFTIRDQDGRIVWTEDRSLSAGRSSFAWDGRNDDGDDAPEGQYTLSVEATNGDSDPIDVIIAATVRIDGVDFSGNEPVLLAGDKRVPLSHVRSVLDS